MTIFNGSCLCGTIKLSFKCETSDVVRSPAVFA